MSATDTIRAGAVQPVRPWPRYHLGSQAWREMARALPTSPELQFAALWADADQVYAVFTRPDPLLVSAPVEAGLYAALSPARPEAAWFERAVGDLWGHIAADAVDPRPLLDHGDWPVLRPMQGRPIPNGGMPDPIELRPAPEGAAVLRHGPIQTGMPGPALVQLGLRGERVVQFEARLGFGHRGVLALARGRTPSEAAPLIARISGRATVAHSLAASRAAEAALGADVPPRALAWRTALAGIERVTTRLYDLARVAEATGRDGAPILDQREAVLRASALGFGHRLLMGVIVPGGLAREPGDAARDAVIAALDLVRPPALPGMPEQAEALGEDVALVLRALSGAPAGPVATVLPHAEGEGLGRAETALGTVWHWLQVREGRIAAAFAADPAMRLWPAMERAAEGARLADVAALAAARGLASAGVDL